jgi:hypothetical protein
MHGVQSQGNNCHGALSSKMHKIHRQENIKYGDRGRQLISGKEKMPTRILRELNAIYILSNIFIPR